MPLPLLQGPVAQLVCELLELVYFVWVYLWVGSHAAAVASRPRWASCRRPRLRTAPAAVGLRTTWACHRPDAGRTSPFGRAGTPRCKALMTIPPRILPPGEITCFYYYSFWFIKLSHLLWFLYVLIVVAYLSPSKFVQKRRSPRSRSQKAIDLEGDNGPWVQP